MRYTKIKKENRPHFFSRSRQQTLKIGKLIAQSLKKGDILCLFGGLGSGKTTLTKGIASGLGILAKEIISPSFVLIREHLSAKYPLYHFDFYRLKEKEDILFLGYEEYLYDDGISVIEWAGRMKSLLPKEYLKISLELKGPNQRLLKFQAFGSRYRELMKKIHEDLSN